MTAVDDYLARLDAALRDVPHGVASEIRAGVAEELTSLDPDAARRRITQLGDPALIAGEALREVRPVPADATPDGRADAMKSEKPSVTRSRGFAIAAAIALGVGGFVVPFAGWFAGVAMVLMSNAWRAWEKVVAVLVPFVFAILIFAVSAMTAWWGWDAGDEANPLAPAPAPALAGWHSALLLTLVLFPVCGLWLLWRLRGRPAR